MTEDELKKLRDFYAENGCPGAVALIDFLVSPQSERRKCLCIGSSTIGLSQIMNEIFLSEKDRMASALRRMKEFHLGTNDGSVTVLGHLQKIAEIFEHIPHEVRKKFDTYCGYLAEVGQAKCDHFITSRRGNFLVPHEAYREEMTDEELAPYRVPEDYTIDDFIRDVRPTKR